MLRMSPLVHRWALLIPTDVTVMEARAGNPYEELWSPRMVSQEPRNYRGYWNREDLKVHGDESWYVRRQVDAAPPVPIGCQDVVNCRSGVTIRAPEPLKASIPWVDEQVHLKVLEAKQLKELRLGYYLLWRKQLVSWEGICPSILRAKNIAGPKQPLVANAQELKLNTTSLGDW